MKGVAGWSGGLGEGDGEAKCFELADVVADLLALVGAAGVVLALRSQKVAAGSASRCQ